MHKTDQFQSWARGVVVAIAALFLPGLCTGCRQDVPEKANATTTKLPVHLTVAPVLAVSQGTKRLLLVHSYHPEYPWVETITEGVRSTVSGKDVEIDVCYMDTKRHPDSSWKQEAGRRAERRSAEYKPDVIVAVDDDAQEYFARKLVGGTTPLVFCGVDADPSKYGYPAENVTGVIERPHFQESIELLNRLRPIRRIAVMSCRDSTSIAALGFMKQEKLPVEVVEWRMVEDFDRWKQAVIEFNSSVDALVIRSYQAVPKAGGREIEDPQAVVSWTVKNVAIPTIAFHDFEIKDGLLAGVVKSGHEYGAMAAEYGLRILNGESPRGLPVVRTKSGVPMVNRETAARLGITLTGVAERGTILVSGK